MSLSKREGNHRNLGCLHQNLGNFWGFGSLMRLLYNFNKTCMLKWTQTYMFYVNGFANHIHFVKACVVIINVSILMSSTFSTQLRNVCQLGCIFADLFG